MRQHLTRGIPNALARLPSKRGYRITSTQIHFIIFILHIDIYIYHLFIHIMILSLSNYFTRILIWSSALGETILLILKAQVNLTKVNLGNWN